MLTTLIELIFKGGFSDINLDFLSELVLEAKEIRLNAPELSFSDEFDAIVKIFELNSYVDLVVTTDKLNIAGKIVKDVFINIGRNNNEIELLFYFDLKDLNGSANKSDIDNIKTWANSLQKKYNFIYCICQMDNAGDEEYYFDSNGIGPLYKLLSGE